MALYHSNSWKQHETKKAIRKSENNAQETILAPVKVIYVPTRDYDGVKGNLTFMQDNGNFKEFDVYSNSMSEKYLRLGNFDIVTVVKNEQARCAIYRNNLNAARHYAREAHELAEHTRCPPLFHAQAYLVMSNVSRNQSKLGKTKKYLDLAKQNFATGYSIEDLAHFYEQYGSYLDKFLGIFPKQNKKAKELALTNYIKMSDIGSQDSRRVCEKKRVYAMIRMARIRLDSNSPFGRKQRKVTDGDIRKAAEYVEVITREHLLENMPLGTKIQYQMVVSDLYYRKEEFEDAILLLKKSRDQAKLFGYKTEGPKITQRLQELERLVNGKAISVVKDDEVEMKRCIGYDGEPSQNESDRLSVFEVSFTEKESSS